MQEAKEKNNLFVKHLIHPLIKEIRGLGLMLALITPSAEITNDIIFKCKSRGLILFWLLYEPKAVRITPPLTISNQEIIKGCSIIMEVLNEINS